MSLETTVFTFKLSNTFEEWVKMFDSPEIDAFHKTVGLTPLYRGKSLIDPKEVIVIHQACLLYTSPSPRDSMTSRMPSSA